MILGILLAATSMSAADDYFPLVPGTKCTFVDSNGLQMVDEVGQPIDLPKGGKATPKTFTISGRSSGSELYRNENDTVYYVGFLDSKGQHITDPQPRLKVGAGKAEWQYASDMPTGLGPVVCKVHGDSSKGSRRKVLDREVDTLIVHVTSQIGNDSQHVEVRDEVVYGKGIGMVEMTEVTKAQGQTVKNVLKLVKIEQPKG